MTTFFKVLASERLKLSRSMIWLLVPLSPAIALLVGMLSSFDEVPAELHFPFLLSAMAMLHAMFFLPILTGIFSSFICRYEHGGGGWKSLLSLPVSRSGLYMAKFLIVALLLAITQLLFLAALWIASVARGVEGGISWELLLPSVIGGWVACLPLAALQLWVSIGWSSFAAPLAINVMFTLPNMLIVNSAKFGPYYPWAQPMLAMVKDDSMSFGAFSLPLESLLITVLGSFIVFLVGGLFYFNRKEI